MPARILQFISRTEQVRLRGQRNYTRYKLLTKEVVVAGGPERAQWHKESAQEAFVTLSGTVGMAPYPVGQAFSSGIEANASWNSLHPFGAAQRLARTTADGERPHSEVRSHAEHLAWRARWKKGRWVIRSRHPNYALPFFGRMRSIVRPMRCGS